MGSKSLSELLTVARLEMDYANKKWEGAFDESMMMMVHPRLDDDDGMRRWIEQAKIVDKRTDILKKEADLATEHYDKVFDAWLESTGENPEEWHARIKKEIDDTMLRHEWKE